MRDILNLSNLIDISISELKKRILSFSLSFALVLGTIFIIPVIQFALRHNDYFILVSILIAYLWLVVLRISRFLSESLQISSFLFITYSLGLLLVLYQGADLASGTVLTYLIMMVLIFMGHAAGAIVLFLSLITLAIPSLVNFIFPSQATIGRSQPISLDSLVYAGGVFLIVNVLSYFILRGLMSWAERTNNNYELLTTRFDEENKLFTARNQKLERRSTQIRSAAEISRSISAVLDPKALLQQVVDTIQARFDLYYVGIFLIDQDGQYAVLKAGTGIPGQTMLAQEHKLLVGGASMIGWAVLHRSARIALDVGEEAVRFENPQLSQTRSEIALPLISSDQVIGALSIQSDQKAAFDEGDIAILQGIADSIATALENAQLFQRLQASLAEVEALHRQYLVKAWNNLPQKSDETDLAAEAYTKKIIDGDVSAQRMALELPLQIRNQTIGQLELDIDKNKWTAEDEAFVNAVLTQATLALENARLLEETRYQAEREKVIRTISSNVWGTTDIEDIMKTAVREISRAMDASQAIIQLDDSALESQR